MVGAIIEIWFAEVHYMIKSVEIGLFKRAMISDIGADSVIEAKWNQNFQKFQGQPTFRRKKLLRTFSECKCKRTISLSICLIKYAKPGVILFRMEPRNIYIVTVWVIVYQPTACYCRYRVHLKLAQRDHPQKPGFSNKSL